MTCINCESINFHKQCQIAAAVLRIYCAPCKMCKCLQSVLDSETLCRRNLARWWWNSAQIIRIHSERILSIIYVIKMVYTLESENKIAHNAWSQKRSHAWWYLKPNSSWLIWCIAKRRWTICKIGRIVAAIWCSTTKLFLMYCATALTSCTCDLEVITKLYLYKVRVIYENILCWNRCYVIKCTLCHNNIEWQNQQGDKECAFLF